MSSLVKTPQKRGGNLCARGGKQKRVPLTSAAGGPVPAPAHGTTPATACMGRLPAPTLPDRGPESRCQGW